MSSTAAQAFDRIAARYGETWSESAIGRLQRQAVWRNLAGIFPKGSHVLDLGCGTGEDAEYLESLGLAVTAIDVSSAMVERARMRGIRAQVLSVEHLDQLQGPFDGAISNFGALNCVRSLAAVGNSLGRLIRSGGHLAICVIGRFCLWETLYFLARRLPWKASRRWGGVSTSDSLGLCVYYPTARQIRRALARNFVQVRGAGIGVTVPPSYVGGVPEAILNCFGAVDHSVERFRIAQAVADHRLLLFVRR